jgi:hypothetical protein
MINCMVILNWNIAMAIWGCKFHFISKYNLVVLAYSSEGLDCKNNPTTNNLWKVIGGIMYTCFLSFVSYILIIFLIPFCIYFRKHARNYGYYSKSQPFACCKKCKTCKGIAYRISIKKDLTVTT